MTERNYCEHHPSEPLQYCSQCLREVRLETRRECAELAQKMDEYREAIGAKKKNGRDDEIP